MGGSSGFGSILGQMFGIPVDLLNGSAGAQNSQAQGASGDASGESGNGDGTASAGAAGGTANPFGTMFGFGDPNGGGYTPAGGDKGPGILETIATWSKRAFIALAIIGVIVLAGAYWWFHPAINLHSEQVWFWIILLMLLAIVALLVASIRCENHRKLILKFTVIPIAIICIFFLGKVAGFSIIPGNAARYASILQTETGDFASEIQEVDYSKVPVIDRDSAALLGNRAMGSIPEYVSQFVIAGTYSQIDYQGTPVRVSPLNYADLFKWFMNRSHGIPAYVLVDMTTQEATIVKLEQPILYSESEPLARNIDRYVQLKYPTYMFDEKSFELDEQGTPWWVFPVQKRTVGLFDGTTIQRVVLVNACTGECQDYAVEDVPAWVDRAYPSDLIVQQYNWHGLYANGWLNSWLGQQGVVTTTPGTDGNLGYNYIAQDGDVYLYTGVSSVTADNSIIGFILVNQRTAEARFYSIAGATEDSAMASAEGQVQNLHYSATFPLLLNIEGEPTYFMALKDAAGLVKKYAMVNITQYQNVAVGDTVAECQKNYVALLATTGTLAGAGRSTAFTGDEVSGTIESIVQAVVDGNSHFYVRLKGDTALYDFGLPSMLEIVTYSVGDAVTFTCIDGGTSMTATGFLTNKSA